MLSWGFMLPLWCFLNCEVVLCYSFILVPGSQSRHKKKIVREAKFVFVVYTLSIGKTVFCIQKINIW